MKQKPNNFIRFFILVCLTAALFLFTACGLFPKPAAPDAPPDTGTPSGETGNLPEPGNDQINSLYGTVLEQAADTLTVKTYDGVSYKLATAGADLETGENGVLSGAPVSVYYTGSLDPDWAMQDVKVKSIRVYDTDAATAKAHQLLSGMTLEEKVGQMFFVRCPKENAAQAVSAYHLGGLILFGRDFQGKTRNEVKANTKSYQDAAKIALLIGVDEEGGTINRISINKAFRAVPFWSPRDLYAEGGWPLIESDTKEKAELLTSLGININLAPVCDIATDPADYMYPRSFGQNAELTSEYVGKVVTTMRENSLGSVLKHFPGYGNNKDTHTGIAYDERSYDTFVQNDFLPFEAGIQAGAGTILVCHNIVKCMDADHPASLSPKVHQILRQDLGFTGVIMTDDLFMDAIKEYTGKDQAAVQAVLAGNDLICSTDFEVQIPAVIRAAQDGAIGLPAIDESVMRILLWKLKLSIIE